MANQSGHHSTQFDARQRGTSARPAQVSRDRSAREFGESLQHYAEEQESSMHDRDRWGDADLYGGPVWDQEHYLDSYEQKRQAPRYAPGGGERNPPGRGFSGKGPKGYTRSDEGIHEEGCHRLSEDDELDASGISVTVANGEVTLEGEVPGRTSKHRAEDLAAAVRGVTDVINMIRPQKGVIRQFTDRLSGRDEPRRHYAGSGTRDTAGTPSHR